MPPYPALVHRVPGVRSHATWLALTLLSLPVLAQTAFSPVIVQDEHLPFRQFDKIEITGSSIIRKEENQALPVLVITAEDIRRTGLKSVAEVVQALPVMANFVEGSQLFMIAGGYSSAAIHGLPSGTLVLVNGLRMAPFGRATMTGPERSGVDLQTLPLSDVERIEVLNDGASSLYGTDAIAGVVNIILRRERKGIEIRADASQPVGGQGRGWQTSLSWGRGQLKRDGYSVLLSAEISGRDELLGADRPYAAQGRYTVDQEGQPYRIDGNHLGMASWPATFEQRDAQGASTWFNSAYRNGACASDTLPMQGQKACLVNSYRALGIYPREDNRRLHLHVEREVGADLVVFSEWLVGRSITSLAYKTWTPAVSTWGLTPGTLPYQQALEAGLDPANTRLHWQPDLPALRNSSEQTNGRWSVGLKGESQGWDHSSVFYVARSQAANRVENPAPVAYDALGLAQGGAWRLSETVQPPESSAGLLAQIETLRTSMLESRGVNTFHGLRVRASRALVERDGLDVMLGLGAEWRREQTEYANSLGVLTGGGQPDFRAQRHVLAAHAELQLPVTSAWELNLGLRTDQYQDVGNTTHAKLSTRWQLNPQWSMRGSLGTGFRAPGVAQMHRVAEPFVWSSLGNVWRCSAEQQTVAGSLKTPSGQSGLCVPGSPIFVLGNGNPDLMPEKSAHLSWGMAFTPHRNLRLAADLWAVHIHDVLLTPASEPILASPARYAAHYTLLPERFAGIYRLDPRMLALLVPMQNLGTQEKAGIDLEAQWRQPSPWGLWLLQARGAHVLRSRTQLAPGEAFGSDLGQYDPALGTVTPRWRASVMGSLTRSGWGLQLVLNHTSGYWDASVDGVQLTTGFTESLRRRVADFTTWDVLMQTEVRKGLELRAAVKNLLNRPAPLSFASSSTQLFGANAVHSKLWGRVIELGLTARF